MLKSFSKYWCLLLLLCLTMVAPALYLHSSFLPSLLFSSSSLPSSSKSAAQLLPSTHSLPPKPSSAAARGSLPQVMSRGAASRESLSSPGEKEAVHIPSSSWSLPSSSSSSKKSSSASSSLLHSLLSSHKGPSRVKREARPSGWCFPCESVNLSVLVFSGSHCLTV